MKRIVTFALFTVWLITSGHAQPQDDRLKLALSADKEIYTAGDRITLTVKFRNTGTAKIYRNTYRDAVYQGLQLVIFDEADHQQVKALITREYTLNPQTKASYTLIKPGKDATLTLTAELFTPTVEDKLPQSENLPEGTYALKFNDTLAYVKPGTYSIYYRYENNTDAYYDKAGTEKHQEDVWKGHLMSEPIMIEVQ